MSTDKAPDNLVDLQQARQERRHDLNEARLQRVRQAFEQALPLPGRKSSAAKKKGKKSRSPRKKK
ncbi:hypothetical protein [Halopseudomonas salegens]|uniref:Uncharacterized protein n=1 Tax=Halopseudomonas salegens TaxID=1434072 RepID=A0A1H2GE95_9GAMM|nr:hypothetical protein [Halopseudomonas salegens]SDU17792.1 hypothetical protein SAMN05216210_2234 [Halopseudomonas salegens]